MAEPIGASGSDYYLPDKKQAAKEQKGLTDPDAFLKILVAQMKYQNPMEPQDSATFITQLSQMASMEQMYNVSRSMDKMATKYEMARYFQLIGRQVSLIRDNELITGCVGGLSFKNGKPYFYLGGALNGEQFTLDQVINVAGDISHNELLPYLALVGQEVVINDGATAITGTVEKALLQNGTVMVRVNGTDYEAINIVELLGATRETAVSGNEDQDQALSEDGTETGT